MINQHVFLDLWGVDLYLTKNQITLGATSKQVEPNKSKVLDQINLENKRKNERNRRERDEILAKRKKKTNLIERVQQRINDRNQQGVRLVLVQLKGEKNTWLRERGGGGEARVLL